MKRTFSSLVMLGLVGTTATQAAKPVTCYDAYVQEVPQKYAAQGGYWGFNLGGNFIQRTNTNLTLFTDSSANPNPGNVGFTLPNISESYNGGEYVAVTTGYRIYRWRFEGELGYRHNKVSKINKLFYVTNNNPPATINNPNPPALTESVPAPSMKQGDTIIGTLMLNVLYDYYYTSGWLITFGLGLGYGATYYDASITQYGDKTDFINLPNNPNPFGFIDFSGYSGAFSGQAIIGTAYRWNNYIETGITYRFLVRTRSHYTVDNVFLNGWQVQFSPEYITNTIALEFRFT